MSELYPGQVYAHKHNANVKRAEENWMANQMSARAKLIDEGCHCDLQVGYTCGFHQALVDYENSLKAPPICSCNDSSNEHGCPIHEDGALKLDPIEQEITLLALDNYVRTHDWKTIILCGCAACRTIRKLKALREALDLRDDIAELRNIADALMTTNAIRGKQIHQCVSRIEALSLSSPLLDYADYGKKARELAEHFEQMFTRITPSPRESVQKELYDFFVKIDHAIWERVGERLTARPTPQASSEVRERLAAIPNDVDTLLSRMIYGETVEDVRRKVAGYLERALTPSRTKEENNVESRASSKTN